jgi:hypothetical protein
MHKNAQRLHFGRQPYAYARAATISISHKGHKFRLFVVASAIVVLWIACLSSFTGSIFPKLNVAVQRQTSNEMINRLQKGDRLAPVNFTTGGTP